MGRNKKKSGKKREDDWRTEEAILIRIQKI
jgi:hypothetical protein